MSASLATAGSNNPNSSATSTLETQAAIIAGSSLDDFRVALEMLNWNVVHFCILAAGLVVSEQQIDQTLPNLLGALRSPMLGL